MVMVTNFPVSHSHFLFLGPSFQIGQMYVFMRLVPFLFFMSIFLKGSQRKRVRQFWRLEVGNQGHTSSLTCKEEYFLASSKLLVVCQQSLIVFALKAAVRSLPLSSREVLSSSALSLHVSIFPLCLSLIRTLVKFD